MPRPFTAITLDQYRRDTFAINSTRRALLRAALNVLRVDPFGAVGVFPVYVDDSGGFDEYELVFPESRGELYFEVDEIERVIVLRSVHWR